MLQCEQGGLSTGVGGSFHLGWGAAFTWGGGQLSPGVGGSFHLGWGATFSFYKCPGSANEKHLLCI